MIIIIHTYLYERKLVTISEMNIMKRKQNGTAEQYTEIYKDDLYNCMGSDLLQIINSHYRLKLVHHIQETQNAISAYIYLGTPP
jgi:hypothetical protein